jgi:hypothetical protein
VTVPVAAKPQAPSFIRGVGIRAAAYKRLQHLTGHGQLRQQVQVDVVSHGVGVDPEGDDLLVEPLHLHVQMTRDVRSLLQVDQ